MFVTSNRTKCSMVMKIYLFKNIAFILKSFLINLINKYANLGEPRENNCWNFANINIFFSYRVISDFLTLLCSCCTLLKE